MPLRARSRTVSPLVRSLSGAYLVIDTAGATKATLDAGADPAYYTVYGGDTVVMTNGTNSALYSISKGDNSRFSL